MPPPPRLTGSTSRVNSTPPGPTGLPPGSLSNGQSGGGGNTGGDNSGPASTNSSIGGGGQGPTGYSSPPVINANVSPPLSGATVADAHGNRVLCTACACRLCRQATAVPWPTAYGSVQQDSDGDIGGKNNPLSGATAITLLESVYDNTLRADAFGIVYPFITSSGSMEIHIVPYATGVDTVRATLPSSPSYLPFAVNRHQAFVFTYVASSNRYVYTQVDLASGDTLTLTLTEGDAPYGDPLPQADGVYFLSVLPGSSPPEYFVSVVTVNAGGALVRTQSVLPYNYAPGNDLLMGIVGGWTPVILPSVPFASAQRLLRLPDSDILVPILTNNALLSGLPTPVADLNRQMLAWDSGTQAAAWRVDGGNTVPDPTAPLPASVAYATIAPRLAVGDTVLAQYNHYNGTVESYIYWDSPDSAGYTACKALFNTLTAGSYINGSTSYDTSGSVAADWAAQAWAALQALGDVSVNVYLPTSNSPGLRLYSADPTLPLPPTGLPVSTVLADYAYTGPNFTQTAQQTADMPHGEAVPSFRIVQGSYYTVNTIPPGTPPASTLSLAADEQVVLSYCARRYDTVSYGGIEEFGYGGSGLIGSGGIGLDGVGLNVAGYSGVVLYWGAFIVKRPSYSWTINLGLDSENPPIFASNGHYIVQMPSLYPTTPSPTEGAGSPVPQKVIIYDGKTLHVLHAVTLPAVPHGLPFGITPPVIRGNYLYFAQTYNTSGGTESSVMYKISLKTGQLWAVPDMAIGGTPIVPTNQLIAANGALWSTNGGSGTTLYRIT